MKKSYITATDQFCGAGGSSQGAINAGVEVRLALNHWELAIETHNTNFPKTQHDCADISAVDPRRYPSTDILITSPECTNHSLAKGKKRKLEQQLRLFGKIEADPAEERSRATAWDVVRFAEYHDYNLIVVENVVDFRAWILYDSWIMAMSNLGYTHHAVYFNSMFAHPTPQSRDRMYVVFWKKGNKAPDLDFRPSAYCPRCERVIESQQTWKHTKAIRDRGGRWGRYGVQYLYCCPACLQSLARKHGRKLSDSHLKDAEVKPYHFAAFNCIDWSIPATRIGDRERPLVDKTMARVIYGFEKYGREPLIITGRYTSGIDCRVRKAGGEALPTQPGDSSHAILNPPYLVEINYTHSGDKRAKGSAEPTTTQTGQQSMGLVVPAFISNQYGGSNRPTSLDEAAATMTGSNHHALIGMPPFIAELRGTGSASGIDEALACVTAGGNNHALIATKQVQAFLSYYYGNKTDSGLDEPLNTVTGVDRAGLVQMPERNIKVEDCTFRMLQPHEIKAAMAFPADYIILGNNREQVKQAGNAVTPPVMAMLIKAAVGSLV